MIYARGPITRDLLPLFICNAYAVKVLTQAIASHHERHGDLRSWD